MEKNILLEEIIELIKVILEQSETINDYKGKIPQIEIDIVHSNIRELYEKYKALEKSNNSDKVIPEIKIEEKTKPDIRVEETPIQNIFHIENNDEPIGETVKTQSKSKTTKESVDLFSSHSTIADKFKDEKKSLNEKLSVSQADRSIAAKLQKNPIKDIKAAIGINEKFKFINYLFEGNLQKYNEYIEKLNELGGYDEANNYLLFLKEKYSWDNDNEAFHELSELIIRRYQ